MSSRRSNKRILVLENGTKYKAWVVSNGWKLSTKSKLAGKIGAIMFTGGPDVNPELYDKKRHPSVVSIDIQRDSVESDIFNEAMELGIPMVGICRGAQFLHVANGGRLIQNVSGHNQGNHEIEISSGKKFNVTSTHHQMMDVNFDSKLATMLAWSEPLSNRYEYGDEVVKSIGDREPESILWKKTKSLCVQWHPENMSIDSPGSRWVKYQIKRLME